MDPIRLGICMATNRPALAVAMLCAWSPLWLAEAQTAHLAEGYFERTAQAMRAWVGCLLARPGQAADGAPAAAGPPARAAHRGGPAR